MAKEHKEIVELVRDHLSGEEKGLEELLLIQALTGGLQGGATIDPNLLLLILAMSGGKRGGRFENLLFATALLQPSMAGGTTNTGMPMPATTSTLPLAVVALGLLDRPKFKVREFPGGAGDPPRDHEDQLQEQLEEFKRDILDELNELRKEIGERGQRTPSKGSST